MTLDDLQNRLSFLVGERQQLHEQLAKIGANISAYNGAISECEHWIGVLNAAEVNNVDDLDTGDLVLFS